ncbi:hypothetical protein chiPu_0033455, partial [Chiloscyllium punctatum]|nr:hypothetical protein [Chiloscyllium punctatum]
PRSRPAGLRRHPSGLDRAIAPCAYRQDRQQGPPEPQDQARGLTGPGKPCTEQPLRHQRPGRAWGRRCERVLDGARSAC